MKFGHHWMMIAALCLAAFGLSGCSDETTSWHQKMTVVVDTPEGERSASSVVSVVATRGTGELARVTAGSSVSRKIRGEAVVLDLGGG